MQRNIDDVNEDASTVGNKSSDECTSEATWLFGARIGDMKTKPTATQPDAQVTGSNMKFFSVFSPKEFTLSSIA